MLFGKVFQMIFKVSVGVSKQWHLPPKKLTFQATTKGLPNQGMKGFKDVTWDEDWNEISKL